MRLAIAAAAAVAALLESSHRASAASVTMSPLPVADASPVRAALPYRVGERSEYGVRFGAFSAGAGSLEFAAIDTVRDRSAYRFVFALKGGVSLLFFKYERRDTLISWVDTSKFETVRATKIEREGGDREVKRLELFPDRVTYSENGKPEVASVAEALDEVSFLFFARTLTLRVGDTLRFPRYYKADRNPVTLVVLRKETLKTDAGTFRATVVQPLFKSRGLFSENGKPQVWIADDSTRAIVKLETRLSLGTLKLELRKYTAGKQ